MFNNNVIIILHHDLFFMAVVKQTRKIHFRVYVLFFNDGSLSLPQIGLAPL